MLLLNTTIAAAPGTLGGFPGGFSWGRDLADATSDAPADLYLRDLPVPDEQWRGVFENATRRKGHPPYTPEPTNRPFSDTRWRHNSTSPSNNVNGPGSGNVRTYLFTATTSATDVDEVQSFTTACDPGAQLSGGFRLHYLKYSTR